MKKYISKLKEDMNVEILGPSKDGNFYIDINNHMYAYEPKDISLSELARKFNKIAGFSKGKAINWLKKNAVLVSGSKKFVQEKKQSLQEFGDDKDKNLNAASRLLIDYAKNKGLTASQADDMIMELINLMNVLSELQYDQDTKSKLKKLLKVFYNKVVE